MNSRMNGWMDQLIGTWIDARKPELRLQIMTQIKIQV